MSTDNIHEVPYNAKGLHFTKRSMSYSQIIGICQKNRWIYTVNNDGVPGWVFNTIQIQRQICDNLTECRNDLVIKENILCIIEKIDFFVPVLCV